MLRLSLSLTLTLLIACAMLTIAPAKDLSAPPIRPHLSTSGPDKLPPRQSAPVISETLKSELLRLAREIETEHEGSCVILYGSREPAKERAARILAGKLNQAIHRLDLSRQGTLHAGTRAQRLERALHQAGNEHGVLFFDEADALFGRRTETGDAHDRYTDPSPVELAERASRFKGTLVLALDSEDDTSEALKQRCNHVLYVD